MDAQATLKAKLTRSPVARVRFMTSLLGLLQDQGVDVENESVLKELGLNLDLSRGKEWFDGTSASTNIITINH